MRDAIFDDFLEVQFEEGMALAESSDLLDLVPVDSPPHQLYVARLRCRGLVQSPDGEITEFEGCEFGIRLPDDYLERAEVGEILTYLGPAARPWHPNITMSKPGLVCARVFRGMPLVELLYTCWYIFSWTLYGTQDGGLNTAAAAYARAQDPKMFPIDRRPVKRIEQSKI